MPKKRVRPISINDYKNYGNCVSFALGYTESLESLEAQRKFNLDDSLPIEEAVIKKMEEYDYELPRRINSIDEVGPNEVALIFFKFTPFMVRIPFMDELQKFWTTHAIRVEMDGTFVHKPGWIERPCEISTQEAWEDIFDEFGREYVIFAAAVDESYLKR